MLFFLASLGTGAGAWPVIVWIITTLGLASLAPVVVGDLQYFCVSRLREINQICVADAVAICALFGIRGAGLEVDAIPATIHGCDLLCILAGQAHAVAHDSSFMAGFRNHGFLAGHPSKVSVAVVHQGLVVVRNGGVSTLRRLVIVCHISLDIVPQDREVLKVVCAGLLVRHANRMTQLVSRDALTGT